MSTNSNETSAEPAEPDETIRFFSDFFGPGMLWALLGIGGSHLVLAPQIGATFGFFGVWVALIVYAAKFGGWELGIRYAYGTGKHPVEGYRFLPGPNNWGLWLTLAIYSLGWPLVLSAVGSVTTSFLRAAGVVTELSRLHIFLGLVGASVLFLLLFSRWYGLVEKTFLLFLFPLAGLLLLAVFVSPPSPSLFLSTIGPPEDLHSPAFLFLIAAFAGYAPTGLSTTATLGSWTGAKQRETGGFQSTPAGASPDLERRLAAYRSGRLDFTFGYLVSFLLIIGMMSLSATVLYPDPPSDRTLAVAIGQLLVPSFGEWTRRVMMIGGLAALLSTVLTVLDGSTRVCSDVLDLLFPDTNVPDWTRYPILLYFAAASTLPVLIAGALPVTLIVFSAALMAVLQIFFFAANYYIVRTRLPKLMKPGPVTDRLYLLSLALVVLFGCMGAIGKLSSFAG